MNKKQGNMLIQFIQFFEALGLPDDLLKRKRRKLKKAGVIVKTGSQEQLIISKYSEYALAELDDSKIKALKIHSLKNVKAYYSLARTYLDEWIAILAIDFELQGNVDNHCQLKEIEDEFRSALADSKVIYEHFYRAFELYLDLVFSKRHNRGGGK